MRASPARVEFIDGAAEAIASFNAVGIPVAVVTNQGWQIDGTTAPGRRVRVLVSVLRQRLEVHCCYFKDSFPSAEAPARLNVKHATAARMTGAYLL